RTADALLQPVVVALEIVAALEPLTELLDLLRVLHGDRLFKHVLVDGPEPLKHRERSPDTRSNHDLSSYSRRTLLSTSSTREPHSLAENGNDVQNDQHCRHGQVQ